MLFQIVSTGPTPEWDEGFAWAFDAPPKGQKLHISCKNKSKFGKVKARKPEFNALLITTRAECLKFILICLELITFYCY